MDRLTTSITTSITGSITTSTLAQLTLFILALIISLRVARWAWRTRADIRRADRERKSRAALRKLEQLEAHPAGSATGDSRAFVSPAIGTLTPTELQTIDRFRPRPAAG